MAFIHRILQEPSYKWADENGNLVRPSPRVLFREALSGINIFRSRKNWLSFTGWFMVLCMTPFLFLFFAKFFYWPYIIVMIVYAMMFMGTHGTIWFHRYCTHRAYKFSHPLWRIITQNLVIKTLPEETYVISHHVHHSLSDLPGDPYNARAGLLYCMLADVNHQAVAKDLSENDYKRVAGFMAHTGVATNTYKEYQRWGSVATPTYTYTLWLLNWTFWYLAFYAIGGHSLATAIFAGAMLWFILVRAFNYTGHGGGKEKHVDGIDFDRSNLAVNQTRPGLFTGEWHNNHHLYPGSARAGFLPGQFDPAWVYIYVLHKIGMVSNYHDSKAEFLSKYYAAHHKKINETQPILTPEET